LEKVVDLILNLIGMPNTKKLDEMISKIKENVRVEVANHDKTNIMKTLSDICRLNNKITIVVDREIHLEEDIPKNVPLTKIYGSYNGRVIIAGDLEEILTYGLKEYIALAGGSLEPLIPKRLKERLANINEKRRVKLFVVPGVPCLKSMHLLGHLAIIDTMLEVIIVDVHKLADYYEKYSGGALPLIIINDKKSKIGAPKDIDELVEIIYTDHG